MATGIVTYWNGQSGWITPSDAANLYTVDARDIMLLQSEVTSGEITPGCTVEYTPDTGEEFWFARSATVI